jgi:hypothetical protein
MKAKISLKMLTTALLCASAGAVTAIPAGMFDRGRIPAGNARVPMAQYNYGSPGAPARSYQGGGVPTYPSGKPFSNPLGQVSPPAQSNRGGGVPTYPSSEPFTNPIGQGVPPAVSTTNPQQNFGR